MNEDEIPQRPYPWPAQGAPILAGWVTLEEQASLARHAQAASAAGAIVHVKNVGLN